MATVEVKQENVVTLTLSEQEAKHLATILSLSGRIDYSDNDGQWSEVTGVDVDVEEVEKASGAIYEELYEAGFEGAA